jgi:vancomycin resistance protein VanW
LKLASQKLNCLDINPQKIFSFSARIGEPTKANGFREAPVFVRGQVLTDVGGGLCLIATNVFNTLLYAGCEILERHCHSIDAYGESRFYELGQDAAVANGYKDLIIRNHSQIPLQLRFEVLEKEGKVVFGVMHQNLGK